MIYILHVVIRLNYVFGINGTGENMLLYSNIMEYLNNNNNNDNIVDTVFFVRKAVKMYAKVIEILWGQDIDLGMNKLKENQLLE